MPLPSSGSFINYTLTFPTDEQGLVEEGSSSHISFAYQSGDGNPAGAVEFHTTTPSISEFERASTPSNSLTWESLGVPPGATVNNVQIDHWEARNYLGGARIVGESISLNAEIVDNGTTNIFSGGLLISGSVADLTTWTSQTPATGQNVSGSYQTSTQKIRLRFVPTITTAAGSTLLGISLDNINFKINYSGGTVTGDVIDVTPSVEDVTLVTNFSWTVGNPVETYPHMEEGIITSGNFVTGTAIEGVAETLESFQYSYGTVRTSTVSEVVETPPAVQQLDFYWTQGGLLIRWNSANDGKTWTPATSPYLITLGMDASFGAGLLINGGDYIAIYSKNGVVTKCISNDTDDWTSSTETNCFLLDGVTTISGFVTSVAQADKGTGGKGGTSYLLLVKENKTREFYKSNDGGLTWEKKTTPPLSPVVWVEGWTNLDAYMNASLFVVEGLVYCVEFVSQVPKHFVSLDEGATWK